MLPIDEARRAVAVEIAKSTTLSADGAYYYLGVVRRSTGCDLGAAEAAVRAWWQAAVASGGTIPELEDALRDLRCSVAV